MRGIFTAIVLCWSVLLAAQFEDDFSNPDLSARWQGDLQSFVVNAQGQLQLKSATAGSSFLAAPYSVADSMFWECYFRMDFEPSGSNRLRIWLDSDRLPLDTGDGTYIEIGESGNTDALRLFRKTGATRTLVASGRTGAVASAPSTARIRVRYERTGEWVLEADYAGGNLLSEEFRVTALSPVPGDVYFGFHCLYTDTRRELFFFDDVRLGELRADTVAPVLKNWSVAGPRALLLEWSEPVDPDLAAETARYTFHPEIALANAELQTQPVNSVLLTLGTDLLSGQPYTLSITGMEDLSGNRAKDTTIAFTHYDIRQAAPFDVLFTELMVRPAPALGLPGQEYIELFNRGNQIVELADLDLIDGTVVRGLPQYVLLPGTYVILCDQRYAGLYAPYGQVAGMNVFPALTDSGKRLVLQRKDGLVIDQVDYRDSWYGDPVRARGGYALELINPEAPCLLSNNWRGSQDLSGGTPGRQNSIWAPAPDQTAPTLLSVYPLSSTSVQLTFDKVLDIVASADPGLYGFDPLLRVDEAWIDQSSPWVVLLELGEPMAPGQVYTLTVSPTIKDCLQKPGADPQQRLTGVPERPATGDLVINEILYEPETGGSRYLELYNRSNKIIDLQPIVLADRTGSTPDGRRLEAAAVLLPGGYAAFSPDPAYTRNRYQPPAGVDIYAFSVPALSNVSGNVTIYQSFPDGTVEIDAVDYSRDFHDALLDTRRGISLERLDPDGRSGDAANWHSAAASVRYGTPGYRNSQFNPRPDAGKQTVWLAEKVFSPDGDGYRDVLLVHYALPEPGYKATLRVYDSVGRPMKTLAQNELVAPEGSFKWDGSSDTGLSARIGIYILLGEWVSADGHVIRFKEDCVLGGQLD